MHSHFGRRQLSRGQRPKAASGHSAQKNSERNGRIIDVDIQLRRIAADAQFGRLGDVGDLNPQLSNKLPGRSNAFYEALGVSLEALIEPGLCLSEVVMRRVPLSFQVARSLSAPVVLGTSTVISMNE